MSSRTRKLDLQARLAAGLRRQRRDRSWSQEFAAETVKINPRHYQKLEEGSVNATLRTLERLCIGFGLDVEALFGPLR